MPGDPLGALEGSLGGGGSIPSSGAATASSAGLDFNSPTIFDFGGGSLDTGAVSQTADPTATATGQGGQGSALPQNQSGTLTGNPQGPVYFSNPTASGLMAGVNMQTVVLLGIAVIALYLLIKKT